MSTIQDQEMFEILEFPNGSWGQRKKVERINYYSRYGWKVTAEVVESDSTTYNGGGACCSGCCYAIICGPLFIPLGLIGHQSTKKGKITVNLSRPLQAN